MTVAEIADFLGDTLGSKGVTVPRRHLLSFAGAAQGGREVLERAILAALRREQRGESGKSAATDKALISILEILSDTGNLRTRAYYLGLTPSEAVYEAVDAFYDSTGL